MANIHSTSDPNSARELVVSVFAKVNEQIELLQKLVLLIPQERLYWQPAQSASPKRKVVAGARTCPALSRLMDELPKTE